MDDDIDIEEHDVLDNPRIKSIFPDLSRVKIEMPDEEDIAEQYDEVQTDDDPNSQENQEMVYQYEYSFETTTDNVEENADYDDGNTYFYNNEIILGSKPPVDPEVLYQEALTSHPIVYLENWEVRLKHSPCYCDSCHTLFPTVNALDAHKMISHSYLIALDTVQKNTARKSTVTSKYCNHCSKTFPDDTSLIKHLYELLPLNNFAKVKEEPEVESPKKAPKFPALVQKWPKKLKSLSSTSKMYTNNIKVERKDVKIEPKDVKIEKEKPKVSSKVNKEGKFFSKSSLVPKSTLFQCNVCQLGFISCFSATQHSKSCEKAHNFEKCEVCKRKIRSKDVKMHKIQHNCTDKLKIYTINKTIYRRVLCKCPKCSTCFDELGFWAHYPKCKKIDKKSTYCIECDVHIATSRFEKHRLKHSVNKLSKKDFIIIEFHDNTKISDKPPIFKRKRMKKSEQNEVSLYYCHNCGCCQYKLQYKGHMDGSCKNSIGRKYCDKCGLCFTAKSISSHVYLHEKRSFTLKNINIISLATGKKIDPPMAKLFKCQKCSKHFLYRRIAKLHNCKTEKFVTCKICNKKFNLQAFKVHKMFHSGDKLIPELIKKYNSINNMWNVLYMCSSCDLVTMTYDSAVTHSQGHLNYIISDLHKNCVKCDLKIAEKEFSVHEQLHVNNQSIERGSFRILKYNYGDLLKNDWMMLFRPLPKQHRQQILSKSIYRYTRSVKMQIEISAPTNDIKYFCLNCNNFVDGALIEQHIKSKCQKNNKFICKTCKETYKSLKQLNSHGCDNIKSNIVTFNNECDKEFNSHLNLIQKKAKNLQNKVEIPTVSKSTKNVLTLYKCAKCKACVTMSHSVKRHGCVPDHSIRLCKFCNQYFSHKKIHMHLELHKRRPDINKNMLNVILFNDEKVTEVEAKIYRCECGLHFTSMKSVIKHIDECTENAEISKEICSKCNLLFPTDVLVTHLVNHHSKTTKIQIENVFKNNLLKCPQCELHFTEKEDYNDHSENCDPKYGMQCLECRLKFGKKCFDTHRCLNDSETYVNKVTIMPLEVKTVTVFKCGKCDINYSNYRSYQYHVLEVDHRNKRAVAPCEICGLKFTNNSLNSHLSIHELKTAEYKIKVIDPINGNCVILTGNNTPKTGNTKTPQKRKMDDVKTSSKKIKKVAERRSGRFRLDQPSTSKDVEFNDIDSLVMDQELVNDSIDNELDITDPLSQKIEELSDKLKARILVHTYNNELFRCVLCNQHYMKKVSCQNHVRFTHMRNEKAENFKCDVCDIEFSKFTLPRHMYVHHEKLSLQKGDFTITDVFETKYDKNESNDDSKILHSSDNNSDVTPQKASCVTPAKASDVTPEKASVEISDSDKILYYKCFDCNVCFVDKNMCLEHTLEHKTLDPMTYIQCKICDFQFLIDSLKEHMILHHATDFRLESVTIHEFKSMGSGLEPKVDIYQAVDKVQSRLVSTTTDVGIV